MAIRIVPYAADHVPMVARFNARMAKAGSDWAFYEDHHPSWIPKDAV